MNLKIVILVYVLIPLLGSCQNGTIQQQDVIHTIIVPDTVDCSFVPKELPRIENENGVFNPNGYNKIYNHMDKVWQEGEFKKGKLYNGTLYNYNSDGTLLRGFTYEKGLQSSESSK